MTVREFLFVDKPAGYATHATENTAGAAEGLVEYVQRISRKTYFVCHRLDKNTSGALVFAATQASAAALADVFARHEVGKRYLLLTDRSPVPVHGDTFAIESRIEKRRGQFVSLHDNSNDNSNGNPNSRTEFHKLTETGRFSLWEARPQTGKPHQIRLHAADAGMPILGDDEHGGSTFPALCLHAAELSFSIDSRTYTHHCPPPPFFERLDLLRNTRLCGWLAAWDRRRRWLRTRTSALERDGNEEQGRRLETWRWIHTEGGPLRAEQLGTLTSLQWFSETPPNDQDWADIHAWLDLTKLTNWRLHLRQDRGRRPNEETVWASQPDLPARWTAREDGLSYEFRADSGLSAGLFLDQRANRRWVRDNSAKLNVLNLFCYTGGFSVCAAAGNAERVVSVDLSRGFLEWAKTNFGLNDLAADEHEFRAMDTREYLKFARKKNLRFDLIICDPPSFSRGDKGIFRIEKDLGGLLHALDAVLAENGRLFFSCNYEGWTDQGFKNALHAALREQKLRLRIEPTPPPDWDFELSRQPRIMKSAFLVRDSFSRKPVF